MPQAQAQIITELDYRHWDHWNDEFVYSHAKVKVGRSLYETLGSKPSAQVLVRWRVGAFGQPIVVEEPKLVPKI
jgi:hypothetical protein